MSLAKAFAGMSKPTGKAAFREKISKAIQPPVPLPLQGTAKSTHPDFRPVKVYLRLGTRTLAERKFQDAGGRDFSDLVETLLQKYIGGDNA